MKTNAPNEQIITWKTWEYEYSPKSRDWYWVVGIISAGIVMASFILGNVLFGILITVAAFTVMLFGARPPREVSVEMTAQGIGLNNELHTFKSIDSFWVSREVTPCVIFKSKKALSPYLIVNLEYVNPDNAREFILKYLPEEEHRIPFAELLSRRLGF